MALDADRIERAIRKLWKVLKKAPRTPSVEDVHDLRTRARDLEAALDAFSMDVRRNERRVLRGLDRVRKRAGKVRDMDVLTSYVATLDGDTDEECRVELLEFLGAERYRHAKALHEVLRRDGAALAHRLKRTRRRLDKRLAPDSDGEQRTAAAAHVMACALALSGGLATPPKLDRRTLHPYRLKVKELRSVLRLAADADRHRFVDTLGRIKDAIGEWHDWEELVSMAADVIDHGRACGLVRQARRIGRRKLEHALALTNDMRRRYLPAPSRANGKVPAKAAPRTAVLEATTAIAV